MTITKSLPCRLLHPIGIGGVGSLQPLPDNVLRLPGVNGNYMSTPDTGAVSITGDIDIRVKVALDRWLPSTTQTLIAKEDSTSTRSYRLEIGPDGKMYLMLSADGTTASTQAVTTNALGFADGSTQWLRAAWTQSTHTTVFYSSSDGVTWNVITGGGATPNIASIYDSTSPVMVGNRFSGATNPLIGNVYYAEVRSGIDGPVVAKFDSSTVAVTGERTPTTHTQSVRAEAIRLPGVAGNYISQPDSVANSVTGDIDVRVKVAMDDWTPGVNSTLLSKRSGGNGSSYEFRMNSANRLQLIWSVDGSATIFPSSSVGVGFSDGVTGWVRATLDVDNGSAQNVATFYTSNDGVTWTPLGTTTTNSGVTSIFDSTSPLLLGAIDASTQFWGGVLYSAEVRNGIDGPVVASFNAGSVTATGAKTPSTVDLWTINGAAWSWDTAITEPTSGALRQQGPVGTENSRVSTPDAADISPAGDLDVRVKVALDDWTPALPSTLMSKWDSGTQRTFVFYQDTTKLTLGYSLDGAAQLFAVSSANTPATDGGVKWVRFTRNATTGDVIFYTSDDGAVWTQLGTTQAGTSGALFDGTSTLNLGADNSSGGRQALQYLYRAEIRTTIDSAAPVAFFDAQSAPITTNRLPATVVQSGRTWTLNGALWSWVNQPAPTPWTVNGSAWWWGLSSAYRYSNVIELDPQYVQFDGTSGNYASTPDSVALSITGDIDLRIKVAMDDWTPTIQTTLIAKVGSASTRSYYLCVSTTGVPFLIWSTDGSATITKIATAATGFADGSTHWLRVTLDVDNGSTQNDVKFYTSEDGVTWTQLGATVTTAGVTSIFDSTSVVEIGSRFGGAIELLAGKVYYAEIRNGVGGTLAGVFTPPAATVTAIRSPTSMSAFITAETWTFNGSAWSWGVYPTPLISTPDSAALSIAGDIDVRMKATMSDWRIPGQTFIDKRSGLSGYTFRTTNTGDLGKLEWVHSDGTVTHFKQASAAVPFTAGQTGWVRATVDVDNTAGGWDLKFYTSSDGVTWTQLGTTVTTATITSIADGAGALSVGMNPGNAVHITGGTIHYAEIRNGIAGTVVGVFNPSTVHPDGPNSPTTIPSPTGEVYTITGSGWRWSTPSLVP